MTAGLVLFNLLMNAALALVLALPIAALGVRVLGPDAARLRVFLCLAPLTKAAYEVLRGIPADAFFWAKLAGATQERGTFNVGLGVAPPVIPVLNASLGALFHGHAYPQSLSDLLQTLLIRHGGVLLPVLLGFLLALVGVLRCAFWLLTTLRGARVQARMRARAELSSLRRTGVRTVRVLISDELAGAPLAGGLLRPWICLPRATFVALSHEQLEAVIAHELAHIEHHDLPVLWLAQALRHAFGFVPGPGLLLQAVRAHMELAADASAARATSPEALASALLAVAERLGSEPRLAHELAFVRRGKLIVERVNRLLAPVAEASRARRVLRVALTLLFISGLFRATLLGNP